jgi:AraC-like DNA-binding protein
MKGFFKDCFFPVENIRIPVSKGKYSPCLTSNQHVHSYWEVKAFPDGNETNPNPFIMLVPPNVIHDSTQNMFSEEFNFVLGFMQPRISLQLKSGERLCLFSQVDDLCPGGINGILDRIQTLLSGDIDKNILEKFLNDLIASILAAVEIAFESAPDIEARHGFPLIERACDYIERQYYHGELTVEKIAEHLGITAGHLANIFKKESLGTVRQYLIRTRLKHAERLLKTGRYTVKDITELTGWNSQFYFSNCFKKHYKIPPSAVPVQPDTEIIKIKDE